MEIEKSKKEVWFMENVKMPTEAGMLWIIDGDTFFCSSKTSGLETWVHIATSQMTILVLLMSLASMS